MFAPVAEDARLKEDEETGSAEDGAMTDEAGGETNA